MSWKWTSVALGIGLGVAMAMPAAAQAPAQENPVEMKSTQPTAPRFEIVPQGPAAREATRPPEADFYREDIRVRYEPAFIEPFVGRTKAGNEFGLSGWTAPNLPVGSLGSQGYGQDTGFFALGITFLFDYPPKPAVRPAPAPR
jgi:hypothetical protein